MQNGISSTFGDTNTFYSISLPGNAGMNVSSLDVQWWANGGSVGFDVSDPHIGSWLVAVPGPVPEPASWSLLAAGLLVTLGYLRGRIAKMS